ncbi:hypothetical protein HRI_001547400 [Hibiscus trionum]|uniref:Uncharacterized protein n=1 Tax=Hibiscus trionum TaxID=183268 RepID=A0A9W7LV39_HIBTR|nr:hypothetical protein HRI_001547400 [Hibiscus trionum]
MGDNLRRSFPFPSRRFLDPQPFVPELTRTNSDSSDSGVTIQNFRDPTADSQPGQSMVWTNEMHNSYLNFLEASFVKQLHYSKRFHGCYQQVGMSEQCPFPQQPAEGHHSSYQFSVLQDGCDQKMNYKSNDHFLESTAESGAVVESPRLRGLTSEYKSSITTFPVSRENVVLNDGIYLGSNTNFSCKSAVNSEQNPIIDSCNHRLGSSTAEVSDQNFVDEDQEEKTSGISGAQRLKITTVRNASSNSQVAPVGKLHTMDDSIISYTSAKRGKKKLLSDHPESLTDPKSDIHYFLRES